MTCDEVFDLLMESGNTSDGLEEHLRGCPRCRNLRTVLSPLTGGEERLLDTGARPFDPQAPVSSEAIHTARTLATRLSEASRPAIGNGSWPVAPGRSLKYVLAFLAGVTAALGVAAALRSEPTNSPASRQSNCLWITRNIDEPRSDDVVLTCVACHLSPSPRR